MDISVIGGDLRQLTLANLLKQDGYSVKIGGFDDCPENSFKTPIDIWQSEIIILPIPASNDNRTVNTPYSDTKISISRENLIKTKLILGGNFSKSLTDFFDSLNIKYTDYLKRDELMIKNAVPSAEGALEIAISETPITVHSSKCLIVGFGRIGKVLSKMLSGIGANVSISARKHTDLAWIEALGYTPIHNSELGKNISEFDIIFNTVPAMILDENILKNVQKNTLIIDLASKPGGVDFETAKNLGVKVIWSLGLPGKVSPITSGKIIKDTVINILNEMEV